MHQLKAVKREIDGLRSGGRGRILVTIAAAWGLLLGTRMIYPVIIPYLRADFGFTLTTAGLLITVIWLAYALGQAPAGILVDRYGERVLLTVSVAIGVAGLVIVLLAPSVLVLFAGTALIGAGMSIFTIARLTALSDLYPNRLGSALGLSMASGDIGQTVIPPLAGVIAVAIAWQAGLGAVIPFLALIGIYLWITLPGHTPPEDEAMELSTDSVRYVIDSIRRPASMIMGGILFVYILVWQSFTAFYPTYLIEVKGLSSAATGVLFGMFFAIGIAAKPIAGVAYDRFGVRSLPVVLSGSVVGFLLLPVIGGFWPLALTTMLIGTMLGSGAITQSYLVKSLPDDIQGTGLGVIRSAASAMGSVGPVLFGAIADFGYFDEGYIALGAIVIVAIAITLRLPSSL